MDNFDPEKLKLIIYPDPLLKIKSGDVGSVTPLIQNIIEKMKEILIESKAIGLAAIQIGIPFRFFIISPTSKLEDIKVYVNPVLNELLHPKG